MESIKGIWKFLKIDLDAFMIMKNSIRLAYKIYLNSNAYVGVSSIKSEKSKSLRFESYSKI